MATTRVSKMTLFASRCRERKKYPSLSLLFLDERREENRFDGKRGTGIPRRSLSRQSRSSSTINKKSSDRSSFVHVPDHVRPDFWRTCTLNYRGLGRDIDYLCIGLSIDQITIVFRYRSYREKRYCFDGGTYCVFVGFPCS